MFLTWLAIESAIDEARITQDDEIDSQSKSLEKKVRFNNKHIKTTSSKE